MLCPISKPKHRAHRPLILIAMWPRTDIIAKGVFVPAASVCKRCVGPGALRPLALRGMARTAMGHCGRRGAATAALWAWGRVQRVPIKSLNYKEKT